MKRYISNCPFCGSKAEIKYSNNNTTTYIKCTNVGCGIKTPEIPAATHYCAEDIVVDIWNKRVEGED